MYISSNILLVIYIHVSHHKFMLEACDFIEKETLAQVFLCELCKIFKNTFFIEHLWWLLLFQLSSLQLYFAEKCSFNNKKIELLV